ncbi:unnamed protein product [Meloidogyne enterolobii]|uniref:Uncharacterized protein n=1 Tax=Meloidogyne enterolobii TaxID=390850 RepID=A0ACB0ZQB9_MELEN
MFLSIIFIYLILISSLFSAGELPTPKRLFPSILPPKSVQHKKDKSVEKYKFSTPFNEKISFDKELEALQRQSTSANEKYFDKIKRLKDILNPSLTKASDPISLDAFNRFRRNSVAASPSLNSNSQYYSKWKGLSRLLSKEVGIFRQTPKKRLNETIKEVNSPNDSDEKQIKKTSSWPRTIPSPRCISMPKVDRGKYYFVEFRHELVDPDPIYVEFEDDQPFDNGGIAEVYMKNKMLL